MKKTLIAFLATGSLALTGMGTVQAATNTTNPVPTNKIIHRLPHADSELATFLGMSATDLETAIKSGKTIEQIAESKGITKEHLTQFFTAQHENMINKMKEKLSKKVQAGTMTQDEMNKIVEKISNAPKIPSTIPFKGGFKKGIRHEVKSSTENVIDQMK